ncbi:MAG TPA: ABC transporter ATP-binding protein [Rhodospirillaceae bacterium]|nr:MAG: ABC transporter ATP-binding protein [Alphaproteobacteria bacterium GWF2_58_20]HAU29539.1 ABC transporter ATP-binding protein [Rhodospirillaceae bacterium]
MTEPPVISIRGLVSRFGSHLIHDGIDLDVNRGEILGLVGASGSGKSVLLRCAIGLMPTTAGHIEILGHVTGQMGDNEAKTLRHHWGVLFQDGALFSSLTVGENIEIALKQLPELPAALVTDIIHAKIALVGLPADAVHKYPSQLSGGMRKRAGLARALALDPDILFLDEPTAGLDPIGASAFDELILQLRESLGLTVFMVTHDIDSLARICDRIAVLVDKKLIVDTLPHLLEIPHPWVHDYFHGPRSHAAHIGE